LGKSVETIGENVFLNSDSLTSITVDEENPYFMVDDGVLYSKDKRELLYCPKNFSGIYRVAEEVKRSGRLQSWSNYAGIALIIFGVWMLVAQFVPELARIQWSVIWPGLVIIVGVLIITRSKHYE
jgi:hypothetical protein